MPNDDEVYCGSKVSCSVCGDRLHYGRVVYVDEGDDLVLCGEKCFVVWLSTDHHSSVFRVMMTPSDPRDV